MGHETGLYIEHNEPLTWSATDGNDYTEITFATQAGAAGSIGSNTAAGVLSVPIGMLIGTKMTFHGDTGNFSAHYYEAVSVTANSSDTGNGGSATDAAYQLSAGLDSSVGGTGWGAGPWSGTFQTTFGDSRTTEAKSLTVSGSVSGTVGGTSLSTPQIASHNHPFTVVQFNNETPPNPSTASHRCNYQNPQTNNTNNAGGGGSHTHPFSGTLGSATTGSASFAIPAMDLKFANVIIAAKD